MSSLILSAFVKAIRSTGQALDRFGRNFEVNPYIEKLQPSTRLVKLGSDVPNFKGLFIGQSSTVIGKVAVGVNSSVWYGAVLRGDVNKIAVGDNTSIGDRAMIHCSGIMANNPTIIGDNVIIGAGSIIHGCTIENGVFIGDGCQVMDGAKVSANSALASGSLLSPGKVIPSGQLWAGIPASYQRDLLPTEVASIADQVNETIELAIIHANEDAKSWEQIELDEYEHEQTVNRNDDYYRRLTPKQMQDQLAEFENHTIPGRVLDTYVSSRNHPNSKESRP
eukprot:gene4671-6562_t